MIEIPLTQGQVALIDDEDFEIVSRYKWCASWDQSINSFYATAHTPRHNGRRTTLRMHRLIMNAQPGQQVDHIHHQTLDNRKSELRFCTNSQNRRNSGKTVRNTSGYKGVCWNKTNCKWQANIRVNFRLNHLGYYATKEEAYAAYCAAAIELHGEFAKIA